MVSVYFYPTHTQLKMGSEIELAWYTLIIRGLCGGYSLVCIQIEVSKNLVSTPFFIQPWSHSYFHLFNI